MALLTSSLNFNGHVIWRRWLALVTKTFAIVWSSVLPKLKPLTAVRKLHVRLPLIRFHSSKDNVVLLVCWYYSWRTSTPADNWLLSCEILLCMYLHLAKKKCFAFLREKWWEIICQRHCVLPRRKGPRPKWVVNVRLTWPFGAPSWRWKNIVAMMELAGMGQGEGGRGKGLFSLGCCPFTRCVYLGEIYFTNYYVSASPSNGIKCWLMKLKRVQSVPRPPTIRPSSLIFHYVIYVPAVSNTFLNPA